MIRFEDIDMARKMLSLGERATLAEIKEAYRRLSLKYHPDKCADEDKQKCEKMFKKIKPIYLPFPPIKSSPLSKRTSR